MYTRYTTTVSAEWLDYNNHMTEGFYSVAFGYASDALLFELRLPDYLQKSGCTFYTAESHVIFLRELKVQAPLRFETQILGLDRKRLHIFHRMFHAQEEFLAATAEIMLLHVDQNVGRVVPMSDLMWERVCALADQDRELPLPAEAGRSIRPVPTQL